MINILKIILSLILFSSLSGAVHADVNDIVNPHSPSHIRSYLNSEGEQFLIKEQHLTEWETDVGVTFDQFTSLYSKKQTFGPDDLEKACFLLDSMSEKINTNNPFQIELLLLRSNLFQNVASDEEKTSAGILMIRKIKDVRKEYGGTCPAVEILFSGKVRAKISKLKILNAQARVEVEAFLDECLNSENLNERVHANLCKGIFYAEKTDHQDLDKAFPYLANYYELFASQLERDGVATDALSTLCTSPRIKSASNFFHKAGRTDLAKKLITDIQIDKLAPSDKAIVMEIMNVK